MFVITIRRLLPLVAACLTALSLGLPTVAAAAPTSVLRIGTTSDLDTANPFNLSGDAGWEVAVLEYDMLLRFGSADLSPEPSLATGCNHSDDFRTWTCTLQPGLKWSDGTPLTSADVAFSYRFVIKHEISLYTAYFQGDPTFETPDPQTLVWKSKEPTFALSMPPWTYIVPEHVWKQYDGKKTEEIVNLPNLPTIASGPYTLSTWEHGQSWTLVRNPYFWGPKPAFDEISYRLYTNQDAMVLALKNGEIDIADNMSPASYPALKDAKDIVVQKVVPDRWLNLAFNFGGQTKKARPLPALKDLNVRRAIAMAIDKQAIVDKVYDGLALPGDTVIRPLSKRWHLDIPAADRIAFDPAAANALLEQSGYRDTNGDGVREDPRTHKPLVIRMPVDEPTPGAVDSGRLIVGFLKAIGITVNMQVVSDAKMGEIEPSGAFDMYIWYWSGDPDPMYQLSVFLSNECLDLSDGCFADKAYDAMYAQQASTMDQTARLAIVQQMQRYLYTKLPGIVLAYPRNLQAYRTDRLEGFSPVPGPDGYVIGNYSYASALAIHPIPAPVPGAAGGGAGTPASPSAGSGLSTTTWAIIVAAAVGLFALSRIMRRRDRDDEA
jgi:peptide/nickel transport system substrate-binding protein